MRNIMVIGVTFIVTSTSWCTYIIADKYAEARKDIARQDYIQQGDLSLCKMRNGVAVNCVDIKNYKDIPKVTKAPLGIQYALNEREVKCLARNITQEAVYNNKVDKLAVAYGTINRVKSKGFPNSICGVISQKAYSSKHKRIVCHMSWYCDFRKRHASYRPKDYRIARGVLRGVYDNPIGQATNWFNLSKDSLSSDNANALVKVKSTGYKIAGSPHIYIKE